MRKKAIFTFCILAICTQFSFGQKMPMNDSLSKEKSLERLNSFMASDEWPVPEDLSDAQMWQGLDLTVDGLHRKAIIIYPKSAKNGKPVPVLFVFHGRRGLIPGVMKNMSIYKNFPEAIVIYPQGLWVDTPNAEKLQWGCGWKLPRKNGDWRDIHLFDALLDTVSKSFPVDPKRIYAMGHSNGGGMTYGLWSVRGDKLAAVSISCSSSRTSGYLPDMRGPKPVFFVIATRDQLVDYDKYKAYIDFIVGRQTTGIPQTIAPGKLYYPSRPGGADVIVDTIEATHKIDKQAMALIADFFRKHYKK